MRSADRGILAVVAVIALIAGFWFVVLAPKRDEVKALGEDVATLRDVVAQQEQAAAAGEQAKRDFSSNYQQLVVMGKAVPEDDDTSSLIAQVSSISSRAEVQFRDITLQDGGAVAATPAAPAPTETPTGETPSADLTQADSTAVPATSAEATEAAAAALPIGATVGPAGLPLMPYSLTFRGGFFQVADFFDGLDDMVHARGQRVAVNGRLLTIDGFNFKADGRTGFPNLFAEVAVSSYVTPAVEGALAGATPSGPAPATATPAATTAPADASTSTSTATSTSTSTSP